jgi:Glycosyltransferase family 87/WD40-like Beta Propeller Repeat
MLGLQGQSRTCVLPGPADRLKVAIAPFLPWMEITACAVLAALLLWKGILPGWRFLNSDFPNYYLVARLLREGYSLDRIYDWIWLQRIKDHWGIGQQLVGFAGLTPFSALPVLPLSFFSALTAKRLWILANLLLLGSSIELLNKVTSLGRRRVWLLCLLAVFPLRTSFLLGQMHVFVLFLLVLAYYFHRKGNQIACGVCLSLAGAVKVYPLLFVLYFLWKRQWRSAFAMVSAALLFLGVGYLWLGGGVINLYATEILPRSLQGEVLDPYSAHTASAAALFHRLFVAEPTLNPGPLINSPTLYAVLYPLWQFAIFLPLLAALSNQARNAGTEQLEWAAYALALLVLSPVPASYHFVVLMFSIVLLVDLLLRQKAYSTAVVAVSLYCMISMVEYFPRGQGAFYTLLAFGRLWSALLLWMVFLFCLWHNQATSRAPHGRRAILLYVLLLAGWTVSALGYRKHFAYLEQDIARRIPVTTPSYLAGGPRQTSAGYLYTAMLSDGYRVLDQAGSEIFKDDTGRAPLDQLSVAVAQNAAVSLVELSDKSGSRVAIVPSKSLPSAIPRDAGESIANAESPAVSADGTVVAFIREVKGRGSLWLTHLEQSTGRPRSEPTQIVDNTYDIRDVNFAPSGWIMFAAKTDGRSRIFSLKPGGQPRVFFSADEDADSPAVSPDGRSVAFRALVHNRWQLGYIDLATGHEQMLTFGDCNAYGPGWMGPERIAYATDCGRGLGLSALASVSINRVSALSNRP